MKPIKEVLPHREPFLFIDEILDLTENSILARSHVRGDDPHFRGHYPGMPVMPGVLLCETVLQAGAYLMATKLELDATAKGVPVVSRMNQVKFKRRVKPGDELDVHAQLERSLMGAHFMKGSIRCKGKTVLTLEFAVNLADDERIEP
jgi:3-hydroxyacyl-[acyl-carrier-protein] dehydratase